MEQATTSQRMHRSVRHTAILAATTLLSASVTVNAGFTETFANPQEPGTAQILAHNYGGEFKADGLNFTNGTITATRVDDANDTIWAEPTIISARAVAAFNIIPEQFGFINGASGGSHTSLFDVQGHGWNVSGQSGTLTMPTSYRLTAVGDHRAMVTSKDSENSDHLDHLVTYAIGGLANQPPNDKTWMLFWEDTPIPFTDFDFNDLAVELKTDPPAGIAPPPLLIPLPSAWKTGLMGLIGLAAVGGAMRLRRKPVF